MIRIYCDGNNGIDDRRFDLSCAGSMADITPQLNAIKEGQRVLFYETDDWEAEGTIHFDHSNKRWFGVPDFSTRRHIGQSADDKNA